MHNSTSKFIVCYNVHIRRYIYMCICHCVAMDHVHITIALVRWMADWLFGGWCGLSVWWFFCLDIGRLCSLFMPLNLKIILFDSYSNHLIHTSRVVRYRFGKERSHLTICHVCFIHCRVIRLRLKDFWNRFVFD